MYNSWSILGTLLILLIAALLPREPSPPTESSKRLDDILRSSFEQTEEDGENSESRK